MPIPKGFREYPAGLPISRCARTSIRTKIISTNKRVLICCPKGKFKNGRCRVGTRATKILIRAR